jgi:hypothetical protein
MMMMMMMMTTMMIAAFYSSHRYGIQIILKGKVHPRIGHEGPEGE